jgi:DNA-binding XRE family transcriptional regulator
LANNVQSFREALMMSKAELARKAGLSTLTIDRVEAGRPCRLDTQRKILLALGLKVSDKDRVFGAPGLSTKNQTVPAALPDGF